MFTQLNQYHVVWSCNLGFNRTRSIFALIHSLGDGLGGNSGLVTGSRGPVRAREPEAECGIIAGLRRPR